MKEVNTVSLLFITAFNFSSTAQETSAGEKYGKPLNLGIGIGGFSGYYRYVGYSLPVFHLNYEFDVTKNFTLAPFISSSTRTNSYLWGDNNKNFGEYKLKYARGYRGEVQKTIGANPGLGNSRKKNLTKEISLKKNREMFKAKIQNPLRTKTTDTETKKMHKTTKAMAVNMEWKEKVNYKSI